MVSISRSWKTSWRLIFIWLFLTSSPNSCLWKTSWERNSPRVREVRMFSRIQQKSFSMFYLCDSGIINRSVSGSVGVDIPRMLTLFRSGHEYTVERDIAVITQIATVNLIIDFIDFNNVETFSLATFLPIILI